MAWTHDEMQRKVRKMAHELPPSDLGSHRAIMHVTNFVFDVLRESRDFKSSLDEVDVSTATAFRAEIDKRAKQR